MATSSRTAGRSGSLARSNNNSNNNNTTNSLSETLSHKSVVEKQRAAIDRLRQQNARLKEDLLLENKFSVRPSNAGATQLINKLQDEADLFTRKIQLERRKVLMLQQQLEQLTSKLGSTRSAMGSIFSANDKAQALQKQIKILENRLEKQYIKYNEAVTYNKQLREQIDNLRRERLMFEAINTNLDKELARIKRSIADCITAANEANAAKDKALAEASSLKLAAEREHAAFEEEWRQLTHLIEDDRHQRELTRQNEMAERERQTQELLKSCEASAANKKKAIRTSWAIGLNKAVAQNVSHQKVRLFGEAFAKIQETTGIRDIDDLVRAFAAAESASYNLFNYVNEVNVEVEALEDSIAKVRTEIDAHMQQACAHDASVGAVVSSTSASRQEAEVKADVYDRRLLSAQQVVDQLKGGIASLFIAAGCNTESVRMLLGGAELSDANMLAHLGIIEQRSNELLQAYALSKPDRPELAELLRAQPVLPTPGYRVVVDPPSTLEPLPLPPGVVGGLAAGAADGQAGALGLGSSMMSMIVGGYSPGNGAAGAAASSSSGGSPTGAAASAEEPLPDDVPLTRAQLQAKVVKNLDSILERSLKVKAMGGAGAGGGSRVPRR